MGHGDSEKSVEQNLSKDYVPQNPKLEKLPITNQVSDALKKKTKKAQEDIEKFKEEAIKKYKYIEAIGIFPAQANKLIEEEYAIPEEECKRGLIHTIVVIPEKQFKNIGNIRLDLINLSKKIDSNLWIHVLTPIDVWNFGLDSKFELMEAISMSFPVFDKGFIGSLRVAQIHKSMVLRKFEKYVTSYVIGGSFVRGETVKTSDVDVFVVIDDTDVKRMPRLELKEKLRGIIYSYIPEAEAIAGVRNILNVQVYLLTDFWEAVKDAHPVMFTFIRDGIPLYDRGAFLPWKSLLRMGKIRPTPEAIDMFMRSGDKLKDTVDRRIFDIVVMDLHWGILTPTQGLLMLYGKAPGNVYDTVKTFRETFVEKEKMVEKKYADILDKICLGYYKAYEHGKKKSGDISGTELDELKKDALDYIKRLGELREQIEKKVYRDFVEDTYRNLFDMAGSILGKNSEGAILRAFKDRFVREGKFPRRLLDGMKFIAKLKRELGKKAKTGKKNKSAGSERITKMDKARRISSEITRELIEYTQRKEFISLNKKRFILKGKNESAEIFFLDDTFLVRGSKIEKVTDKGLVKSNSAELGKQLSNYKEKNMRIDFSALEILRKFFEDFDLISLA